MIFSIIVLSILSSIVVFFIINADTGLYSTSAIIIAIKNDVIFNYLFSHEDILKDFLEACLEKNIKEIKITNQLDKDLVIDKTKNFLIP